MSNNSQHQSVGTQPLSFMNANPFMSNVVKASQQSPGLQWMIYIYQQVWPRRCVAICWTLIAG